MRTRLFLLIVSALLPVIFYSCVTTKTYSAEEKKMRDAATGTYVLTNNGDTVTGKKISQFYSRKDDAAITKIDDKKVRTDDVKAYQDNGAYYVKFQKHVGYEFVKQLKRGAINLYYYETLPTSGAMKGTDASEYHEHFVFEKKSVGLELAELSITDIASILKDNAKAYKTFTDQFGSGDKKFLPKRLDKHPQVLFEAVDIYNGNK